jgi:phosphatidylserine decarboxylase
MRAFLERMGRRLSIRREQASQARRIHGGLLPAGLAVLAVHLSRLPVPSRLRRRLFVDTFARKYPPGLDASEAECPLESYRSFNALFTRGMKPEHRPIPRDTPEILSPCDGRVQDLGRVEDGTILTLKGIRYSLASLLPGVDIRPFEGGRFAIVFLSPIDCHRVFSPGDGALEEVVHVPGSRLLVHPPFQRPEFPVYTLNERVILRLSTESGPCLVVMVAGWGVGHITLPFDPDFRKARRKKSGPLRPALPVRRGDWIATFELGSTVVLITSSSQVSTSLVSPDEEVRYGQPVLRIEPAARPS